MCGTVEEKVSGCRKRGLSLGRATSPGSKTNHKNTAFASFWEHIKSTYADATEFSMVARAFCSHIEETRTQTLHTHLKN